MKATLTGLDGAGYKPYPDDSDDKRARVTRYLDKGETADIPQSEYDRLKELGAWDNAPASAPAEVTAPGGQPTSEPTDPQHTPGTPDAPEGTPEPAREASADAEGGSGDGLDGMKVAELADLAKAKNVAIGPDAKKADLIASLRAANVSKPSS